MEPFAHYGLAHCIRSQWAAMCVFHCVLSIIPDHTSNESASERRRHIFATSSPWQRPCSHDPRQYLLIDFESALAILNRKETSCLPLPNAGFEPWKSETPNCQQTECTLTNQHYLEIYLQAPMYMLLSPLLHLYTYDVLVEQLLHGFVLINDGVRDILMH